MKPHYVPSEHAKKRRQQRGTPREAVDVVLAYGAVVHHFGGRKHYMNREAHRRAKSAMGADAYRRIVDRLNIYVVLSSAGVIVTVAKLSKRLIVSKPNRARKRSGKRRRMSPSR